MIQLQTIEGTQYIKLVDLQNHIGFRMAPVVGTQNIAVSGADHSAILSANRSLVSIDEKLVSLSKPVYLVQGVWLVPLDFIPKVLRDISTKRFLWMEGSRSLILGNAQANQVILKHNTEEKYTWIVFQSLSRIGYGINVNGNVLTIIPQSQDFSPAFQNTTMEDGVVKSVNVESKDNQRVFKIQTGGEFGSFRTFELKDPPRYVVDLYRKSAMAQPESPVIMPEPQLPTVPPTLLPSPTNLKKVIVIDPGHGGSETGAKGAKGTLEKDVTMNIARKLRAIVESTGMRAILTRDGDQLVSLDDRTSKANNNRADLFISIHANATIRGKARGAETYFLSAQATDDEARNIAAVENNAIGLAQAPAYEDDVMLILWDMAQTEFLAESSQLAEMIQQELNTALSISNRGIKQAPFRVLTGATMPAVLIEVGFINNPDEEKLMSNGDYQMKIAAAIFRSILKFQNRNPEAASKTNTSGQ